MHTHREAMARSALITVPLLLLLVAAVAYLPQSHCQAVSSELAVRSARSPTPHCPHCSRLFGHCGHGKKHHEHRETPPNLIMLPEPYVLPPPPPPVYSGSYDSPMSLSYDSLPNHIVNTPPLVEQSSYDVATSYSQNLYKPSSPPLSIDASQPDYGLSSPSQDSQSYNSQPAEEQSSYGQAAEVEANNYYSPPLPPPPPPAPPVPVTYEVSSNYNQVSPLSAPTPVSYEMNSNYNQAPALPAPAPVSYEMNSNYNQAPAPPAPSTKAPPKLMLYPSYYTYPSPPPPSPPPPPPAYTPPPLVPSASYSPPARVSYPDCPRCAHCPEEEEYRPLYYTKGESNCNNEYQTEYAESNEHAVVASPGRKYKKRSEPAHPARLRLEKHKSKSSRLPISQRNLRVYERDRRSDRWAENQARERVFVVYRADPGSDEYGEQQSSPGQDINRDPVVKGVIRKAIEIARQEWAHEQQPAAGPRYYYETGRPVYPNRQPDYRQPSQRLQPPSYEVGQAVRPSYTGQQEYRAPEPSQHLQPVSHEHKPEYRVPVSRQYSQPPIPQQHIEIKQNEEEEEEGMPAADEDNGDESVEPVTWAPNNWPSSPALPYADRDNQPGLVKEQAPQLATVTSPTDSDKETAGSKEVRAKAPVVPDVSLIEEIPMPFTEPSSYESPIHPTTDSA